MVYNKAIKAKVVSKIHYPFSKEGYKISKLKSQKKKKALSEEEFEKIIGFDVEKALCERNELYRPGRIRMVRFGRFKIQLQQD